MDRCCSILFCCCLCCCLCSDFNSLFRVFESMEPHVGHSSAGLANDDNLLLSVVDSYVSFRSVSQLEQKYCNRVLLICGVKTITTKPYGEKIRYGIVPNKGHNSRKRVVMILSSLDVNNNNIIS